MGLYYLQSRYYNPEIGRFINADALVSTGKGFIGNNMFAYCLNNPISLSDSNGLRPTVMSNPTDEARVDSSYDWRTGTLTINSIRPASTGSKAKKNFVSNIAKSDIVKSIVSSTIDTITGKLAGQAIKERMVYKEFGTLTLGKYTSNLSKGAQIGKKAIGTVGTIAFTAWDVHDSISKGEYFGAGVDIVSSLLAFGLGAGIGLIGAPAIIGGGATFLLGLGIGYGASKITDKYYGR